MANNFVTVRYRGVRIGAWITDKQGFCRYVSYIPWYEKIEPRKIMDWQ